MEQIIERYGCLIKVENLWCLSEMGIPNTCLLESLDVFPGYYGDMPRENRPKFVYFVAAEALNLEQVSRISMKVKKQFPLNFDAAFCEISMRNNSCSAIRITNLHDYSDIRSLQEAFHDCGLMLKKKIRYFENEAGLIKIRKFFTMEVCGNGVFFDKDQLNISYFSIPAEISWEELKDHITMLRNNWQHARFDAAKCFIYEKGSITDLIRIFSQENSCEFSHLLRDKYYEIMRL